MHILGNDGATRRDPGASGDELRADTLTVRIHGRGRQRLRPGVSQRGEAWGLWLGGAALSASGLVRELVLGAQRRPLTRSRLRPICMRR